jgi:hypothetical protein
VPTGHGDGENAPGRACSSTPATRLGCAEAGVPRAAFHDGRSSQQPRKIATSPAADPPATAESARIQLSSYDITRLAAATSLSSRPYSSSHDSFRGVARHSWA